MMAYDKYPICIHTHQSPFSLTPLICSLIDPICFLEPQILIHWFMFLVNRIGTQTGVLLLKPIYLKILTLAIDCKQK